MRSTGARASRGFTPARPYHHQRERAANTASSGWGEAPLVVAVINLTQRLTPSDLQGRAYSAVDVLVTTPQTISIVLGAALITITGYPTLLLTMTAVMVLAAIYLLSRPQQESAAETPSTAPSTGDDAIDRAETNRQADRPPPTPDAVSRLRPEPNNPC